MAGRAGSGGGERSGNSVAAECACHSATARTAPSGSGAVGGIGQGVRRAEAGGADRGEGSSPSRYGLRPLRPDRKIPRVYTGAVAVGAGKTDRKAGKRHHAGGRDQLDVRKRKSGAGDFVMAGQVE